MQDTVTITKREYFKLVKAQQELGHLVVGSMRQEKSTRRETLKNLYGIWNGTGLNVERELKNIRGEWRNDFA